MTDIKFEIKRIPVEAKSRRLIGTFGPITGKRYILDVPITKEIWEWLKEHKYNLEDEREWTDQQIFLFKLTWMGVNDEK